MEDLNKSNPKAEAEEAETEKRDPSELEVPLSLIPRPVYEISMDFIRSFSSETLLDFVRWAYHLIITEWQQRGVVEVVRPNDESKVATFVVLAMVLRTEPGALTFVSTVLRDKPKYQGQDTLPVLIWMMAQAFSDDLTASLHSWAWNLLPLVANNEECYSSHSFELFMQFVEMVFLKCPEAPTLFRSRAVRNQHRERLIPPFSFQILVRLTFPAPSARVEATLRFEEIYPLLKQVALATDDIITCAKALEQIFTFSLELAGGKGNPALASEATAIAISVLTQNVDCFKQWDVLYNEHLEASAALLKKLVDEWKDHSLKLSSSFSDTLTVENAMNSFRMKSCKLISRSLYRGPGIAPLTEKGEETEKEAAILSLSEAAKKIDPSHLSTFLDELWIGCEWWVDPEGLISKLWKLIDYYGIALSQISFQSFVNMFEEYPLSKLIHVPLSLIPRPVYEISMNFIRSFSAETLSDFVRWAYHLIITEWRRGVVEEVVRPNAEKSKVQLINCDKNPFFLCNRESVFCSSFSIFLIKWSQAFSNDLTAALHSWAWNLLPLVANNEECYSSHSLGFIPQFVEMLLSQCPTARRIFLGRAVRNKHEERLIPPRSFEILVRLTFPAPSARVEATERFEAIYPLLKEVALATDDRNPALASEATAIAISVLTKNVDCFKLWDVLYKEHLEASAALLKKLVDEWKDHSLKLSSSDTLTVENAINSFRMKNVKAITEGVANLSLYKEADKACKLISVDSHVAPE
ncbi:unnamed protein product [Eruca vesicaria subsp. sativa]|uniref:Uncharacterized protein n=1 Tax=Eruca vesicaria subsp. sativa TaxID=29727 RepID=A0ABC8J266_ERUVS|nr:unnamed protein product [Eruca vesicaria subsp. sativa]